MLSLTIGFYQCSSNKPSYPSASPHRPKSRRRHKSSKKGSKKEKNVVGVDPNGIKPPEVLGMAGTNDVNYATLNNLNNNVFDGKDGAKGIGPICGDGGPKVPDLNNGPIMKDAHDPQYQTLNALDNNVFDKKDGGGGGVGAPKAPEIKNGQFIVPADEKNYQTLNALDNNCFDKK
uniref:Uncharacterized protein n=1 Tax=Parastrongyloides trichosuri TaxID=131310 RepID=A0A0N4ZQX6_PARTI